MTVKWNDKQFKEKAFKEISSNANIVGAFVVKEARRRLLAIKDPKWGADYRRYVADLLTYEVVIQGNEVTIRVGVKATSKSRHHGFYIEFGSKTSAPHSFLRTAVYTNAQKIVELLGRKGGFSTGPEGGGGISGIPGWTDTIGNAGENLANLPTWTPGGIKEP